MFDSLRISYCSSLTCPLDRRPVNRLSRPLVRIRSDVQHEERTIAGAFAEYAAHWCRANLQPEDRPRIKDSVRAVSRKPFGGVAFAIVSFGSRRIEKWLKSQCENVFLHRMYYDSGQARVMVRCFAIAMCARLYMVNNGILRRAEMLDSINRDDEPAFPVSAPLITPASLKIVK